MGGEAGLGRAGDPTGSGVGGASPAAVGSREIAWLGLGLELGVGVGVGLGVGFGLGLGLRFGLGLGLG